MSADSPNSYLEAYESALGSLEKLIKPLDRCTHRTWGGNKEKTMSTEDYKRGVEDATKPLNGRIIGVRIRAGFDSQQVLDEVLEERRKSLLTKKVTRWVNIHKAGHLLFSGSTVYSSKAEAEDFAKGSHNLQRTYPLQGTYPIEIEVPIDFV